MIAFDVTRQSTFEAVSKWKNDLDSKVQLPDGQPIPCVLLANKVWIPLQFELVCTYFCTDKFSRRTLSTKLLN